MAVTISEVASSAPPPGLATRPAQQDPPICARCAASVPQGRLTLRGIGLLVTKHLKLERGLLHTLWDLLIRPGVMLTRYIGGRRSEYVNPVTYLLLSAALSLLTFEIYREDFAREMRRQMQAALGPPSGGNALGSPEQFSMMWTDSIIAIVEHTTFTSFAMVLPVAGMFWLMFRRRAVNLAESMAIALYSVGTALFLHSLLVAPMLVFDPTSFIAQRVGLAIYLLVPLWMGLAYFGWTKGNIARLLGVTAGGYLAGTALIYGVALVVLAFKYFARA